MKLARGCARVSIVLLFLSLVPYVMFVADLLLDGSGTPCLECNAATSNRDYIPERIHQIFFNITSKRIPEHLSAAQRSWTKMNPDFEYTLWNSSMVETLIKEKYPTFWNVYRSYNYWVQRADFARYIILHQYGGIYADIDIECVERMSTVIRRFPTGTEFVMYRTSPSGVSNDFLVSKPKQPFISSVISGLPQANRWYLIPYLTVFLSTGPLYLYGRYAAFQDKSHILILEGTNSFLRHKSGAAWHRLDGKIIWWLYIKRGIIMKYSLFAFIVLTVIFFCKSRRFNAQRFKYRRQKPNVYRL